MERKMPGGLEQFQIKSGTRALGVEYEDKMTGYLSLLLAQDQKVRDFKISSNDPKYGNFDDIVMEVEYNESGFKEFAAIQLKHHHEGKPVPVESFLGESGDFSLLKYFKETEEAKISEDVCLVLFTNRKFHNFKKKEESKITLKDKSGEETSFLLEIFQQVEEQPSVIKFINSNTCSEVYQFKVNKIGKGGHERFENFLKRLYFYSSKDDVRVIETKLKEQFLGQPSYEQFVKFIENWSKEPKKFKLNKGTIIFKFMECLLWPHCVNLCENICDGQEILFDKVFLHFDAIIFEKFVTSIQGYDKKFIEAKRAKINWMEEKQFGLSKETDVVRLLWHINELPLIIKSDCPRVILRKVLNLPKHENYSRRLVIIGKVDEELKGKRILRNFSDFFEDEVEEFFKNCKIGLQGREWPFVDFVKNDKELATIFRTKEMVHIILEKKIILREVASDIFPYINRLLQKPIIRWEAIKDFSIPDIFVISCKGKKDCLNYQETGIGEREQIIFFEDSSSAQNFVEICARHENKNVHQLEITEKNNLLWIFTKGNVEKLAPYFTQETNEVVIDSEIFNNFRNKINILCADPGMGKSVLMEFLKQKCPKDLWPILINIRECIKIFRENRFGQVVDKIIDRKYKRIDLTREIVELMKNRKKILFLWDGLDEVPQEFYEDFLEGVNFISQKGYFQWVASRNHLRNMLEQKLHLFASTLAQLNDDNQRLYIRKRLNYNIERENQIMTHLKNSVHRDQG